MSGIAHYLTNAYTWAPTVPDLFNMDAVQTMPMEAFDLGDAGEVQVAPSVEMAGDAFVAKPKPVAVAVKERPNTASLETFFASREHHAMVVSTGDSLAPAEDPVTLSVTKAVKAPKPSKEKPLWTWNPVTILTKGGFVSSVASKAFLVGLWIEGCSTLNVIVQDDSRRVEESLEGMAVGALLLGTTYCFANAWEHCPDWMEALGRQMTKDLRAQEALDGKLRNDGVARLMLDEGLSDREYQLTLNAVVKQWKQLNPVEQAAFLRADAIAGHGGSVKPVVLQGSETPVSVGLALQRLADRYKGMELTHAAEQVQTWNKAYEAKWQNATHERISVTSGRKRDRAVTIAARLANIPAARRTLRGVEPKVYRGLVRDAAKQWKRLNPMQQGIAHIADRLMETPSASGSGISLTPKWESMAPGFVLAHMIERLGMTDLVIGSDAHDPVVWYGRYQQALQQAQTHPVKTSVRFDARRSRVNIDAYLLQMPEVRSVFATLTPGQYRRAIGALVKEWYAINGVRKAHYRTHDMRKGLVPDDDDAISPSFIALRFCERYLGMGEKGTRERFKLDAKVREELEAWYRSYREALEEAEG